MGDLQISPVRDIDIYTIRRVLISSTLTDEQKLQFMQRNAPDIKSALKLNLNSEEYDILMQNRPLLSYKPIKNAFTKKGDKVMLAKALGIPESRINLYIDKASTAWKNCDNIDFASEDGEKSIKTYVYRHGTKDQLISCFQHDIAQVKNIENFLSKHFQYDKGGLADYFRRPIHRLDNTTLLNLFGTINQKIRQAESEGKITDTDAMQLSALSLTKLYALQNNSRIFKKKTAEKI